MDDDKCYVDAIADDYDFIDTKKYNLSLAGHVEKWRRGLARGDFLILWQQTNNGRRQIME